MNIGKYINELLADNDLVIIPGFGAFVLRDKPAQIIAETEEIIPPSKELYFDEKIRNNDGLLVGIVANNEKISHFDALKEIEKERENIFYQLDKGQKVSLENTGTLFYDPEHKLCFESVLNPDIQLDSFGLEAASSNIDTEVTEEDTGEQPAEINEKTEEPEPQNKTEENQEDSAEEEDVKEEVEEKITATEKQDLENVEADPQQEPDPEEIETEPEPEITTPKEKEEYIAPNIKLIENTKQHKKNKKGWLWFLALIPLLFAAYIVWNKQFSQKRNEQGVHPETLEIKVEKNELLSDSIATNVVQDTAGLSLTQIVDSTTADSVVPSKTEDQSTPEIDNSPKYILVGGSFKNKENADKYLEQLASEGFEPFHLGKRGNFFIVGIGKYNSESEALAAKSGYVAKNPKSGIWIKKE